MRAHRRSSGHTHRRGRLGVTLRMRDFFQLVQTISFNVRKTARKEPIALPSRAPIDAVHRLGRQRDAHARTLRNRVHVARILAVTRRLGDGRPARGEEDGPHRHMNCAGTQLFGLTQVFKEPI